MKRARLYQDIPLIFIYLLPVMLTLLVMFTFTRNIIFASLFSVVFIGFVLTTVPSKFVYRTIIKVKTPSGHLIRIFTHIIGLFSIIMTIVLPTPNITIQPNSILQTILAMQTISLIRVILGYYIACFYPGFLILEIIADFLKSKSFFEKINLILLMSIIYTGAIGGVLFILLNVEDSNAFLIRFNISVISLIFLLFLIKLVTKLKRASVKPLSSNAIEKTKIVDIRVYEITWEKIILVIIVFTYVLLSYCQIIFSSPLSGLLWSDPANYVVYANSFIFYRELRWIYIGMPIYVFTVSRIVGLSPHFTFVGLQFLQMLIPLTIYDFANTLTKNEKTALFSVFIILFLNGVTSALLLTNYKLLATYLSGDEYTQLTILYYHLHCKVGSPGSFSPHCLTVFTIDMSLTVYSLKYVFEIVKERKCSSFDILLASLLIGAAYYFHSWGFILVTVVMLIFFLMFDYRVGSIRLLAASATIMIIIFECISGFYFLGYFVPHKLKYSNLSIGFYLLTSFLILLGVAIFLLIRTFTKNILRKEWKKRVIRWMEKLPNTTKIRYLLYIVAFLLVFLPMVLTLRNIDEITWRISWETSMVSFPWYFIIYKYYGIVLSLAILSTPYLFRTIKRSSLIFLLSLTVSMLAISLLSKILPIFLPPTLICYRFLGYLLLPLGIMSSIFMERVINSLRRLTFTNIGLRSLRRKLLSFIIIMVFILSNTPVQLISQIHSYEVWYLLGNQAYVSPEIIESINWINKHMPKGAVVLPLSSYTEKVLTNLAVDIKVIPISSERYRELILKETSYNRVLSVLVFLGVRYIYLTTSDTSYLKEIKSPLLKLLNKLLLVYKNSVVRIYEFSPTIHAGSSHIKCSFLLKNSITFTYSSKSIIEPPLRAYELFHSLEAVS